MKLNPLARAIGAVLAMMIAQAMEADRAADA